jgi:hypothetical protein
VVGLRGAAAPLPKLKPNRDTLPLGVPAPAAAARPLRRCHTTNTITATATKPTLTVTPMMSGVSLLLPFDAIIAPATAADAVGVTDGVAPNDTDAVVEGGIVRDGVLVVDVPSDGVIDAVAVSEGVFDGGGVLDTEGAEVMDTDDVADNETVGVREDEREVDAVADGEADGDGLGLGLGVADGYSASINFSVFALESKNARPGYEFTSHVETNVGGSVFDSINGDDHVLPASLLVVYTMEL